MHLEELILYSNLFQLVGVIWTNRFKKNRVILAVACMTQNIKIQSRNIMAISFSRPTIPISWIIKIELANWSWVFNQLLTLLINSVKSLNLKKMAKMEIEISTKKLRNWMKNVSVVVILMQKLKNLVIWRNRYLKSIRKRIRHFPCRIISWILVWINKAKTLENQCFRKQLQRHPAF